MKSLMLLLDKVLQDCSTRCCTTTTRDALRIKGRVEEEGLSFLTITLGSFASDFERGLEVGYLAPNSFRAFGKNGPIPKLFSGMVRQVFNMDGKLLDKPSIAAISCIRQVCRMWKKILVPCTLERNRAAIEKYVEIDQSLIDPDSVDEQLLQLFDDVSGILWSSVLGPVQEEVLANGIKPRHGKGAVVERILRNQKYEHKRWHSRLDDYFPVSEYAYSSVLGYLDKADQIEMVSPEQEQPVRVVLVPKTQTTPRVIAMEPVCMQYVQQGLSRLIVNALESHPLTKGRINFRDQTVNSSLATEGSKHGLLSTLDLSEASDRVHSRLVYRMLRSVPDLRDRIFACRSTKSSISRDTYSSGSNRAKRARVFSSQTDRCTSGESHDGDIVLHLQKFASMGSALCFPIESIVFYTLLLVAEAKRKGLRRVNAQCLYSLLSGVYVYGDDLITPTYTVRSILQTFETFGLKVNAAKSFWTGKFRESCGVDAYDGVDVTPVYVRRMPPKDRTDVESLVSWVSLGNQLLKAGYPRGAHYVRDFVLARARIPDVSERAACVGFVGFSYPTISRWNRTLHRPEVKGLVAVPKREPDVIDGWAALTKWFLASSLEADKTRYTHSVSSGSLAFKSRWCPVY